ncbi:nucleotide-binding universal stress UspA family protein [Catenulispora sp. GP43]|jgi:nucleotide-binding universal stress UspA family protein|uniref:universal stress protein n=1 Tax=Catenulispora sp. GP43 TaxID=3156263 RepID=UPI0035133001
MVGRRVVVGVDDSDNSLIALDAAAAEAALRRRPLHVVHADPFAGSAAEGLPEPGLWVDRAVRRAGAGHPELTVTGEVARGFPQAVLVGASRDAELVVIGDRGLGALARALAETVAGALVLKTSCPVLVTRGLGDPGGPIAVGVDGSAVSQSAVGFAFAEADLRGRRLAVVHAWTRPEPHLPGVVVSVRIGAERLVSEASAGWCEKYPDVLVSDVLVHGLPRHALIDAGESASLMVVGARGRTMPAGLGSVSRHLVYRAPCPVVVVPR